MECDKHVPQDEPRIDTAQFQDDDYA